MSVLHRGAALGDHSWCLCGLVMCKWCLRLNAVLAVCVVVCRLPPPPEPAQLSAVVKALKGAKQPVSE